VREPFSPCVVGLRHQGKSWTNGLSFFIFFLLDKISTRKKSKSRETGLCGSPGHSTLSMRVMQEENVVTSVWTVYPPNTFIFIDYYRGE